MFNLEEKTYLLPKLSLFVVILLTSCGVSFFGSTVTAYADDIPVSIVWQDHYDINPNNYDPKENWNWARPETVSVSLLDGDTKISEIELTKENQYASTFTNVSSTNDLSVKTSYTLPDKESLLKYKRANKSYTYDYDTKITGSATDGFTITNTLISNIQGEIILKGDNQKPDTVKVNLLKNGEIIDSQIVNKNNNYKFDFGKHTVYSDTGMILYTTSVDKVENYFSEPNGYDIILTPETKITLTKELKGTSNEKEFGVYIVPVHYQTSMYIRKLESRYPLGLHRKASPDKLSVKKILDNSKEYDKTSGRTPIYPLLAQLFDEKWLDEKIANNFQNMSKEDYDHFFMTQLFIYGENHLNDNIITAREQQFSGVWENDQLPSRFILSNLVMFEYFDDPEELSSIISGGEFKSFDEYVDSTVIDHLFFYTTIKAGETKTVGIPAENLMSLMIFEVDYDDTEEFEPIYWNKITGTSSGNYKYGDVAMSDYIANGFSSEQARNEFEYNLVNIGKTIPGSVILSGKKNLMNKELTDKQFSFILKENNTIIDETTCDANGNFTFKEIEYSSEGEHNYVIEEKNDNKPGYTYDNHQEKVKVIVTKNDNNEFVATPQYDSDGIVFNNEYKASGSISIKAVKKLENKKLTDQQFSFELYDADNQLVATTKNTSDGSIDFGNIEFSENNMNKELHYKIVEVNDKQENITYDNHTEQVIVKVTDNGDGTLQVISEYDEDGAVFVNTFSEDIKEEQTTPKSNSDGTADDKIEEQTTPKSNSDGTADDKIEDDVVKQVEGKIPATSDVTIIAFFIIVLLSTIGCVMFKELRHIK